MNKILLLLFLLVAVNTNAQNYAYLDGSGNKYELIGDTLEYNPVKKENSSSGEYSGGEYKKVFVSEADKKLLKDAFEKGINAKGEQQDNRAMLTGMIIREKKKTTVILKSNSEVKKELEKLLKEILSK